MGGRLRERIRSGAGPLVLTARSVALRRAQLSFGAMWATEWALLVGLAVVAFRDGGAAAVGVVGALRLVPAALLAPFAATIADRVRREGVLAAIGLTRAAALGSATAVLAADGPPAAVYALAVLATIAQTLFRPAHSALLPAICSSPEELTSANVVRGMLDSAATLAGPLAAAGLLAASGPAAVFAACAAASLWAGALVSRLPYDAPPRAVAGGPPAGRAVSHGFRSIAGDGGLLLITFLTTVQAFTRGCFSVLAVVVAIELLGTGEPGVGILNAALGAGAVLGSLAVFRLLGHGGLAVWLGVGVTLWGAPLAILAAVPEQGAALVLLAVVGVGNVLVDVGAFTLPARLADEAVMARTFAAFEGVLTLGVALGAVVAPVVIDLAGIRVALVVLGLVGPAAVAATWPALRRLDARMRVRDADIRALRDVPMLEALPEATIEQLASSLERDAIAPGGVVFEQGEPGDRFYVVEEGSAEVVRDGRVVGILARGDCFGEIALLRHTVRTATVRAGGSGTLRVGVLARAPFLTAVTGYPASAAAGERVVETRLQALAGTRPVGAEDTPRPDR